MNLYYRKVYDAVGRTQIQTLCNQAVFEIINNSITSDTDTTVTSTNDYYNCWPTTSVIFSRIRNENKNKNMNLKTLFFNKLLRKVYMCTVWSVNHALIKRQYNMSFISASLSKGSALHHLYLLQVKLSEQEVELVKIQK